MHYNLRSITEISCPFQVSTENDSSISGRLLRDSVCGKYFMETPSGVKEKLGDRYIPCRHTNYVDRFSYPESRGELDEVDENSEQADSGEGTVFSSKEEENLNNYSQLLENKLFGDENEDDYWKIAAGPNTISGRPLKLRKNVFRFRNEIRRSDPSSATSLGFGIDTDIPHSQLSQRKISKMPFKILDAPQLQDDFYLNLVDWSSQNFLGVGLGPAVYVWSACTSKVVKLCDAEEGQGNVTSVAWNMKGNYLAVGVEGGETQIWDAAQLKKVKTLKGHGRRVSAISWNDSMLSTGSRDKFILQHDLRASEHFIARLHGHKHEVCGLKWSFDGTQLASGGNDNKLCLWDVRNTSPIAKFADHQAAVKALAWSPHQRGLLASGGGTADRTIKFWDTLTCECVKSLDTGSQVCNLTFSKNVNELVSTHGYSLNQIIVWTYPRMRKIATLTGHTYRVLYLSMSPDGESIVTGAGDETLRFWNVFPPLKTKTMNIFGCSSGLIPSSMEIR
eukprot:TRINITY_DN1414_c0_g1_i4.p1 TRINITY_DN1414_c0_g1~~TRINITY_DN1414_c0_g1_i4.p1  ORF type:complete len:505 (-),score=42.52 TRINITY_DN1414_c0_g1_i4:184-1698(-)